MSDYMAVLTARSSEIVSIGGFDFEVRSLTLKEAKDLQKKYNGKDGGDIAMILASVFIYDKPAFTEVGIGAVHPGFLRQFDAAIGRVNQGPTPGKLKRDGDRRFCFRLASKLGCTVAELEERLTVQELHEWIEFYQLEPWGFEVGCYQAGIVAATIANVHRDAKRKQEPFTALDFVPKEREGRSKKIDGKLLKAQLQAAFIGMKHGRGDRVQGDRPEGVGAKAPRTRPGRGNKDR